MEEGYRQSCEDEADGVWDVKHPRRKRTDSSCNEEHSEKREELRFDTRRWVNPPNNHHRGFGLYRDK